MSDTCLIGVDIGTTGAKAVLVDEAGAVVASAMVEYPLSLPRAGWAEQDPDDWVRATVEAIRSLLRDSSGSRSIAGLALSGQMHGLVCVDANGKPLRPAILWCDTRTSLECREIEKKMGGPQEVLNNTFNAALEGFTLPKLLWVRKHEPDVFSRTATVLLPKDYVRFRLTGELGMDLSDASGTVLLDVRQQQWSLTVADAVDVDIGLLPPLGKSADIAGTLTAEMAEATGLPLALRIAFGGADNACAAVGTGVVEQGQVAVSIGSSGTVIAPVPAPRHDPRGRVHTFLHAVPDTWYIMGVMQAAGLSLKWFREILHNGAAASGGEVISYATLGTGAERIPAGSEGLLWLPYLNGERTPHLDPNARGVLFGITARHSTSHIVRAIMEGVAFGLKDCLKICEEMGVDCTSIRLTGGGGKSPIWRQIIANVLQKPVVSVASNEGPAYGAAIIAGVATATFPDFHSAAEDLVPAGGVTEPSADTKAQYDEAYGRYGRLYEAVRDEFTGNV